jgi:hypothetical protein
MANNKYASHMPQLKLINQWQNSLALMASAKHSPLKQGNGEQLDINNFLRDDLNFINFNGCFKFKLLLNCLSTPSFHFWQKIKFFKSIFQPFQPQQQQQQH